MESLRLLRLRVDLPLPVPNTFLRRFVNMAFSRVSIWAFDACCAAIRGAEADMIQCRNHTRWTRNEMQS